MIIAILFGALLSQLVEATNVYKDCEGKNFEPKACKVEKVLHDLGEQMQKLGAVSIITGMIIPWLIFISVKTFSHDSSIVVIDEKLRILEEVRQDVKTLLQRGNK